MSGYGWLRLRNDVCVHVCMGGGWRMWSPEAIHVHLAAHLPCGDLSSTTHIWFKLKNIPTRENVTEPLCGKGGDGWMWEWEGVVGRRKGRGKGGSLRSGLWLLEVFLCVWRDLNTVIYFTSPKQIRQDISTQAENWRWRWVYGGWRGQQSRVWST